MKIAPPLFPATFEKRYKRFFADVRTPSGELLTLHCPNTGSMKNCLVEGSPCWYSLSDNPKRKLPGTLEIVTSSQGNLAGVNTSRPNYLVREVIEADLVPELQGYSQIRTEVRYGEEKSRIDLLLEDRSLGQCYVEVKNVTLDMGDGLATFPDAVTSRGTKHLRELMAMVAAGHRAVLFFCVQLTGVQRMEVAAEIDPGYAATLSEAVAAGVEVIAWRASIGADQIVLDQPISCLQDLPGPEL
ncbi:DNA/RNA nuclease SfsA [SAR92 clade bacterium H231]|jgi:sugar fermentation stimulation protein A|nr:DNA/RNA nuclease SfsA [Porticoccaceae bacterium]MCT2532485.1 DNA/RNA nuclease SfsA [SAR92 clade bacterium H231]MBT7905350.1 DNA/RNA nuclease SfsA [Porticoccaceae bacterium]MDG1200850.1 DNA/RNA nuclease SfsA [Porticoccaceae bacterium]MDG1447766.1 DNA/RNA nuclease SfsA [Porticoccaceae bacterium]